MTRKMNIQSNLDKNSPWADMEAKFDVLSVVFKDCEICSSLLQKEEKKYNKAIFFLHGAQIANDQFLVSRIFLK